MRHDERQRARVTGPDVDEMDLEAVDLGHELRECVQPRLGLPPVVIRPPVAQDLLQLRELDTLRTVAHRLSVGPPRRSDTPPKVDELLLRNSDAEGADRGPFRSPGESCGQE